MKRLQKPQAGEKPRVRFCWVCSRKLYGKSFVYLIPEDEIPRVCHRSCAESEVKAAADNGCAEFARSITEEDMREMLGTMEVDVELAMKNRL